MRAFAAVDLPAEFEDEVAALARSLHACVEGRFLKRQTYHVTLAFLGEINEADARRAIDALERACAQSAPVLLEPKGFERFGHRREGLLALALEADPGLVGLAENLRSGLRARGVAHDEKRFSPHISLVRRARLEAPSLPDLPFPHACVAEFATLYKSTLTPEGALYKPLYTVDLLE